MKHLPFLPFLLRYYRLQLAAALMALGTVPVGAEVHNVPGFTFPQDASGQSSRAGQEDFFQLEATGVPVASVTRYYTASNLPPGLSLAAGPGGGASVTGLIQGTPTTPGTWQVQVQVSNRPPGQDQTGALTGSTSFAWTVAPAIDPNAVTAVYTVAGHDVEDLKANTSGEPNAYPFAVTLTFSKPVTGLTLEDFKVQDGTLSNLSGSGTVWKVTLHRLLWRPSRVELRAETVTAEDGTTNQLPVILRWKGSLTSTITLPSTRTDQEGAAVSFTALAGGAATWTVTGLPPGLAATTDFITGSLTISGQLPAGTSGLFKTTVNMVRVPIHQAFTTEEPARPLVIDWTVLPATPPPGWTARYFDGREFQVPVLTRTDAAIDFDWDGAPAAGLKADTFSVKWSGILTPRFSEIHTFTIAADNGTRLWIDGRLVSADWNQSAGDDGGWRSVEVPLTAHQPVTVLLDYYQSWGGANAALFWTSASEPWALIPADRLSPVPGNAAPLVAGLPDVTQTVGTFLKLPDLVASDVEGAPLVYEVTGLPPGIELVRTPLGPQPRGLADLKAWNLSGTATQAGTWMVTVSVSTAPDSKTQRTFVWKVVPATGTPDAQLLEATALVQKSLSIRQAAKNGVPGMQVSFTFPEALIPQYRPLFEFSRDLTHWQTAASGFTITPISHDPSGAPELRFDFHQAVPGTSDSGPWFVRVKLTQLHP